MSLSALQIYRPGNGSMAAGASPLIDHAHQECAFSVPVTPAFLCLSRARYVRAFSVMGDFLFLQG